MGVAVGTVTAALHHARGRLAARLAPATTEDNDA
jgi:DNA-directed RNA polymerase specialized sigma24 family protein